MSGERKRPRAGIERHVEHNKVLKARDRRGKDDEITLEKAFRKDYIRRRKVVFEFEDGREGMKWIAGIHGRLTITPKSRQEHFKVKIEKRQDGLWHHMQRKYRASYMMTEMAI